MSGYVLFQMWEAFRESRVKRHSFYMEQARKRLLSQFDGMEGEADQAAEEWLDQRSQHFDPDREDPGSLYDAATEAGIEFYGLLSEMREQTRLSVVAGMFHEWDKQLRDWLTKEIRHWHDGDGLRAKIWAADFVQITDLLESFGWNLRSSGYFRTLDACRLVVNVYKHGDGKSLDELRTSYPEYLDARFSGAGGDVLYLRTMDHMDLRVSDDQVQVFSDAILDFWRNVPEIVRESQLTTVPQWFENAILKDRTNLKQTSKT